jgi:ABC-type cobalamin/Fe3+-siderophores transport system ATPase subunit
VVRALFIRNEEEDDGMEINVTIKNYRCFPDHTPVRISIRPGFTALIGINNSGKSALLKFFYEMRDLFSQLTIVAGPFLSAINQNPHPFSWMGVSDTEEPFNDSNGRGIEITLEVSTDTDVIANPVAPLVNKIVVGIPRATNTYTCRIYSGNEQVVSESGLQCRSTTDKKFEIVRGNGELFADLRLINNAAAQLRNTLYIPPFRNAINAGQMINYYDIHVGQAFINEWSTSSTGTQKKLREATYRLTNDISRLFGFNDLKIEASSDKTTLIITIDGRSYKLADVGSGIAQFVMVLASAARVKPDYILIDEPELNLHPALQLDFLTTLASYAPKGGIVYATHSFGLARATANRIYSVQREGKGGSQIMPFESTPRLAELLGELSFSGYKELGFEQLLLVEGSTELLTFQQFLRLYNKEHQTVLLPLGGSQLINSSCEQQLSELTRITKNICAVVDSERNSATAPLDKERAAFRDICQQLGIRCHVLERRATENYLSDSAIKRIKGPKYRSLSEYELLSNASPMWGKSENWLIAREMQRIELDATDLGKFLSQL